MLIDGKLSKATITKSSLISNQGDSALEIITGATVQISDCNITDNYRNGISTSSI